MQILSASVVTYYILALYILLKTSFYSASLANIQRTIIQRFTKTAHNLYHVLQQLWKETQKWLISNIWRSWK